MSKNPIFHLILTGWRFAEQRRRLILVYLVLFAGAQAAGLSEPYIIGQMINAVQHGMDSGFKDPAAFLHSVYFYLFLYFVAEIGFWVFHGPGRLIECYVAFHIRANYKNHMFKVLTELPLQWHRVHHSGDSIDKINRASTALFNFYETTFQSCYMFFRLIGAGTILFLFMPTLGWAAAGTAVLAVVVIYLFDRVLFHKYRAINKNENAVASALHDYITNIISIITLRLESRVRAEVWRRMQVSLPVFRRSNVLNEIKWCLTNFFIAVLIFASLAWYAHSTLMAGKIILAGTFFTLFEYLRGLGESFYNFAMIYGTVVQQAADVMSAEPLRESHAECHTTTGEHRLPVNWRSVDICDLNFVYEDERHRTHHLDHVSIRLDRTAKIAFVGESGSGKSTLLNLLRGTLVAHNVQVFCDSVLLPHGLEHLASHTTLMPQSPEIFSDTLRFNITFGIEADEAEVRRAVSLSRFEPVLTRLPEGLETNISEKGVNLSGGECQRLALARGIFFARESDIVLLDEPTSSVDPENERLIYRNLLTAFADKCVISSIHKLHLLDMFDLIYVFRDGHLIEHGDLQTLLEKDGCLASMWKASSIEEEELAQIERVTVLDGSH